MKSAVRTSYLSYLSKNYPAIVTNRYNSLPIYRLFPTRLGGEFGGAFQPRRM